MSDVNATARWLGVECRRGLMKYLSSYLRRHSMLRRESLLEIEDHVSRSIETWIRRDAFAERLSQEIPPKRHHLGGWAVRIALNAIRDRGTDAHTREMYGARTGTERSSGLKRSVEACPEHGEAFVGEEGETELYALNQKTAESNLQSVDFRKTVSKVLHQECTRSEDAADRLLRVWELLVEDFAVEKIAEDLNVSPLRAGHLAARVRNKIRQAEITVQDAMRILNEAGEAPLDKSREDRRTLKILVGSGLLRMRSDGRFQLTEEGRVRLKSSRQGDWASRLLI